VAVSPPTSRVTSVTSSDLGVTSRSSCMAMPVVVMTQGFVVFLAFCYFACLFLAFFILYLIFEI